MRIWIDAQLSPALAEWITESFDVEAVAVRDLDPVSYTHLDVYKRQIQAWPKHLD